VHLLVTAAGAAVAAAAGLTETAVLKEAAGSVEVARPGCAAGVSEEVGITATGVTVPAVTGRAAPFPQAAVIATASNIAAWLQYFEYPLGTCIMSTSV
jgi:hypothetical protein